MTHWNSNTIWTCNVCSAAFQRLDHLKRHSAAHRAERPFLCDFCGSSYKRGCLQNRDILRRHWKCCAIRIQTSQAIPEPRQGGKERHACDCCARLKRSCSGGQPCSECDSRKRPCSYERLGNRGLNMESHSKSQLREWGGESAVGHDMDRLLDYGALDVQSTLEPARSTWDLGPQNFYASADVCYKAYGRLS